MKGSWRIVSMPDYADDFPDMMEPATITLDGVGGGEFVFGCVTGAIHGAGIDGDTVHFRWYGSDEMDEVSGSGWVERQADNSLRGEIQFDNGDEAEFIAHPLSHTRAR